MAGLNVSIQDIQAALKAHGTEESDQYVFLETAAEATGKHGPYIGQLTRPIYLKDKDGENVLDAQGKKIVKTPPRIKNKKLKVGGRRVTVVHLADVIRYFAESKGGGRAGGPSGSEYSRWVYRYKFANLTHDQVLDTPPRQLIDQGLAILEKPSYGKSKSKKTADGRPAISILERYAPDAPRVASVSVPRDEDDDEDFLDDN